ncbi:hypothetical protein ABEB36_001064 [Hypothenemus hampei]|uniref:C2H2-type domain-containing protein n=1 Tax=Hypothenemus hampei TaxID=57062 RepID=A0ABD1FGW9_HYPHA
MTTSDLHLNNCYHLFSNFLCPNCGNSYKYQASLKSHLRFECGVEKSLKCPLCPHKAKRKHHMQAHIKAVHKKIL